MGAERISIFQYHDYREFLRDQFELLKKSKISLRRLAQLTEVSAPFLSMVLSGHKNIPGPLLSRLILILKLKDDEAEYLKLLAVVSDSEDQSKRLMAFGEIQNLRSYRTLNPKETEVFQYMTKWYYVAIRELAMLPDFDPDPHWIQEKLCFQVPIREIQKAVDFLIKQKLFEVDEKGKISLSQKNLNCTGGVYRLALTQYYQQIYALAFESIGKIHRDRRYMMGDTLAIPESQFVEFKQIVDECFKKIVELKRKKSDTDSVYHIGFFGFPMASSKKEAA